MRTTASYHEIAATHALFTERGSPVLTVLGPTRFEETQARRRDAVREHTIIEMEATFPRGTEAGDEPIGRLLNACIDAEARVVTGEVQQDAGAGEAHAAEGSPRTS